jgi:sulfatase modifying factor 1
VSADDGKTWTKLSDEDHEARLQTRRNGTVHRGHPRRADRAQGWHSLGFGRVDKQAAAAPFDHKLPISISTDGGKTWTYSISEFPDITSGQRITLKALKEGPLLLCTFTDDFAYHDADGRM